MVKIALWTLWNRGPGRSTHHTAMGILPTDGSHQAPLQELSSAEELPCSRRHPLRNVGIQGFIAMRISSLQSALQCLPVASLAIVLQPTAPPPQSCPLYFLPGIHQGASSPTHHLHTNLHPIVCSPGYTT